MKTSICLHKKLQVRWLLRNSRSSSIKSKLYLLKSIIDTVVTGRVSLISDRGMVWMGSAQMRHATERRQTSARSETPLGAPPIRLSITMEVLLQPWIWHKSLPGIITIFKSVPKIWHPKTLQALHLWWNRVKMAKITSLSVLMTTRFIIHKQGIIEGQIQAMPAWPRVWRSSSDRVKCIPIQTIRPPWISCSLAKTMKMPSLSSLIVRVSPYLLLYYQRCSWALRTSTFRLKLSHSSWIRDSLTGGPKVSLNRVWLELVVSTEAIKSSKGR